MKANPQDWADVSACVSLPSNDEFWSVHDFLFREQSDLNSSDLQLNVEEYIRTKGSIAIERFTQCMEQGAASAIVDSDLALARQIEVNSTPTVFVNDFRINGVASPEQLRTLIHPDSEDKVTPAINPTLGLYGAHRFAFLAGRIPAGSL